MAPSLKLRVRLSAAWVALADPSAVAKKADSNLGGVVGEPPYAQPPTKEAAAALVEEYWKKSVATLDGARARAQAGYAVVSAIIVALAGGAFLARVGAQSVGTKTLAAIAAFLWLLSTVGFLRAITFVAPDTKSEEDEKLPEDQRLWVEAREITADLQVQTQGVSRRLKVANSLAIAAVAVTIATFGVSLFSEAERDGVAVVLTGEGQAQITKFCPPVKGELRGSVDPATLTQASIAIYQPQDCPRVEALFLPRSWVTLIAEGA